MKMRLGTFKYPPFTDWKTDEVEVELFVQKPKLAAETLKGLSLPNIESEFFLLFLPHT